MRKLTLAVASAALAFSAAPALAQNNGLVVVDLSNANVELLNNLAQNLNIQNVNVLRDVQVQVPIGIAAAICDVNANVLAKQRKNSNFKCTAQNQTTALTNAVRQKMAK